MRNISRRSKVIHRSENQTKCLSVKRLTADNHIASVPALTPIMARFVVSRGESCREETPIARLEMKSPRW